MTFISDAATHRLRVPEDASPAVASEDEPTPKSAVFPRGIFEGVGSRSEGGDFLGSVSTSPLTEADLKRAIDSIRRGGEYLPVRHAESIPIYEVRDVLFERNQVLAFNPVKGYRVISCELIRDTNCLPFNLVNRDGTPFKL